MKKSKAPKDSGIEYPVWTAEDLELAVADLLGGHGWRRIFADAVGISYSTMSRYSQGELPVPQYVAIIAEMLVTLSRHGIRLPDAFGGAPRVERRRGIPSGMDENV